MRGLVNWTSWARADVASTGPALRTATVPGSPWLALRQAREAIATGRPDEAHRLIEPLLAEGYRKAYRLARDVAAVYCTRGRRFLDGDNPDAAWGELLAAEALNTGEKCVAELRLTLTRFGMVRARGALEAGRPLDTIAEVARLRDRGVRNLELTRSEVAAQDWVMAAELADKGEFLRSLTEIDRVGLKLPCPADGLDRYRAEVEARHERFRAAVGHLYDAAEGRRWREALAAADEVLATAPEHREARVIRAKAWRAAHPETAEYGGVSEGSMGRAEVETRRRGENEASAAVTRTMTDGWGAGAASASAPLLTTQRGTAPPSARVPMTTTASPGVLPRRFLLWVDGAGGFLVCTGPRVTFGHAVAEGPIDVPLYADVSRLHAEICRDGEGYVIESGKGVLVNGRDATRAVLSPEDRVTLGATCQFVFRRPVPVSATTRLELSSGHRLLHPVDAVLLMANELVLGPPGSAAHVEVPDATGLVSLFRSPEGLGIRVKGEKFRVGDHPHADRAVLAFPATVSTDTFGFAVEAIGPRV